MNWRINMLGGLEARLGETVLTRFETRKTAALLALLALRPHRIHPRDELAEQLWPEEDWEVTRNRLRQALAALRKEIELHGACPNTVLIADRSHVRIAQGAITTDVGDLEEALCRAHSARTPLDRVEMLQQAVALWRGQLMPGYYEDLIASERTRLHEVYVDALGRLATAHAETGDLERAIYYARVALSEDPLRESSCTHLMRLYAADGRVSDALRQFAQTEQQLWDELGARPSGPTRRLAEQLRAGGSLGEPALGRARSEEQENTDPAMEQGLRLEPVGGAIPLDSPYYIERTTDREFLDAVSRQDSIVLVKGPRQVGKTSLLARGLHLSRKLGRRVLLTDLQKFEDEELASADTFFLALAGMIAEQLDLSAPEESWKPHRGANANFERYMRREVLNGSAEPVCWGLDEVDRLFSCSFGGQVFALLRAWHNERSLDPDGPWERLTIAMAYATEAHLFITDMNQSPFNVGTRLTLDDFDRDQVATLNQLYGYPLRSESEADELWDLVGGHPFLVRRCLHILTTHGMRFRTFVEEADRDGGPFADHLGRIHILLSRSPQLAAAVRAVVSKQPCPDNESFLRLRSAGVFRGEDSSRAALRCGLYARYLSRTVR